MRILLTSAALLVLFFPSTSSADQTNRYQLVSSQKENQSGNWIAAVLDTYTGAIRFCSGLKKKCETSGGSDGGKNHGYPRFQATSSETLIFRVDTETGDLLMCNPGFCKSL